MTVVTWRGSQRPDPRGSRTANGHVTGSGDDE
jgi:hypothetical protein